MRALRPVSSRPDASVYRTGGRESADYYPSCLAALHSHCRSGFRFGSGARTMGRPPRDARRILHRIWRSPGSRSHNEHNASKSQRFTQQTMLAAWPLVHRALLCCSGFARYSIPSGRLTTAMDRPMPVGSLDRLAGCGHSRSLGREHHSTTNPATETHGFRARHRGPHGQRRYSTLPSTPITCPETRRPASEHRNRIMLAMS